MALLNAHKGSWFGLPDFGITEAIQRRVAPAAPKTAQGGSNLSSLGRAAAPAASFSQVSQPVNKPTTSFGSLGGGNVLEASTGGAQPAGGVGGQPQQTSADQAQNYGAYEQSPEAPQIDYDSLIAPALQALDEAVGPAQSSFDANVAGIEAGKSKGVASLQQGLTESETAAGTNRQRVSGEGESAIDEARRQFSEIQQGLQSRFGKTTGTGKFASEMAGSQSLRNIGQIRQNIQQAMTTIDDRLEQVRGVTKIAIEDAVQQAEAQKKQAKAELDQQLNSIRMARGELQSRKMELAQQSMQFYQQQVAAVNQRNAAFTQSLFQQQQAAEQKLADARSKGESLRKQFELVNIGDTPYLFNPYTGSTQANPQGAQGAGSANFGTGDELDDELFQ